MKWQHNATPFVPSLALNDDWSDYTIDELRKLCPGNSRLIQITLSDSSMYDRYYKDDLVNIECGKEMPDAGDALMILPDDSVIFRCYEIDEGNITIYPFYKEFCDKETYPVDEVQLVGLARNVIRIG